MTQATSSSQPNTTATQFQTRTILHISDLHFGRNFNHSKWSDLKLEAGKNAPDVVIITGDLVNTPWRWMWSQVKSELDKFATELKAQTTKSVIIRAIPGNHDTRISGIYPVQWLLWTAFMLFAFSGFCYWLCGTAAGTPWFATALYGGIWTGGAAAILAIALRISVSNNPKDTLGDYWLTTAELFGDLSIGVLPFDSASTKLSWARGHVPAESFVQSKTAIGLSEKNHSSQNGRQPIWIAAVHHHPLPLPYDSENEHMMVMDNAGAFLRELARCDVKLVLHGHKHHQHFARIAVDPASSERVEIAVLSAGTPTEGTSAGSFRHGFNIIRVRADDWLTVEKFEAEPEGGTYFSKQKFDVVLSEQHARAKFEKNKQSFDLWCRQMVCIADINAYGDASFVREFHGVKTERELLNAFPSTLAAHASSGSIESCRAYSLSNHGPGVKFKIESREPHKIVGRVTFSAPGLQRGEDPINIRTEFQGNNAFALNRWQLESMYPKREDDIEYVSFRAPADVALNELVLHVQFPKTIKLPKRLEFRWCEDGIGTEQWAPFKPLMLVRLESQNAVGARISYPVPNAVYQINWDLQDEVQRDASESAIASASALRRWLANLNPSDLPTNLTEVLKVTETWVRERLAPGTTDAKPLQYALYSYNEANCQLRVVASNYPNGDERHRWVFQFGLGLPGRAFKTAAAAVFTRPHDWKEGRALGYLPGREMSSDEPPFEPEATILAIPLAPTEATDWPYAVLQISTDDPTMRLHTVDTP
jgi:hypothetical protein